MTAPADAWPFRDHMTIAEADQLVRLIQQYGADAIARFVERQRDAALAEIGRASA